MTPVLLQQFRLYYDTPLRSSEAVAEGVNRQGQSKSGKPIGVVFWAYADAEVEARLAAGGAKLRPPDWKSGEALWVVDILAPFGGADAMLADLKQKVFPAGEFRYRGMVEGKAGVMVV